MSSDQWCMPVLVWHCLGVAPVALRGVVAAWLHALSHRLPCGLVGLGVATLRGAASLQLRAPTAEPPTPDSLMACTPSSGHWLAVAPCTRLPAIVLRLGG